MSFPLQEARRAQLENHEPEEEEEEEMEAEKEAAGSGEQHWGQAALLPWGPCHGLALMAQLSLISP